MTCLRSHVIFHFCNYVQVLKKVGKVFNYFMYILGLSKYVNVWALGFSRSEKRVANEKGGR